MKRYLRFDFDMATFRHLPLLAALIFATPSMARSAEPALTFTAEAMAKAGAERGVVLLAVHWDRQWSCGDYRHAQLTALAFDRAAKRKDNDQAAADITLTAPDGAGGAGVNYAFIVEPGEYWLSGYEVAAMRENSETVLLHHPRSRMIHDGVLEGGRFSVAAGELVYIGDFALACGKDPTPWRHFMGSRGAFADYLATLGEEFAGLPTDKAVFRLFETYTMGVPFTLP